MVLSLLAFSCSRDRTDEKGVPESLLELREREGRDNAMIHYYRAMELAPVLPGRRKIDLTIRVMENGWHENAAALLPYFEKWKPALVEIRKGAALDYARNVTWDPGITGATLSYLSLQTGVRVLCLQGRYWESQGRDQEALENYLVGLTVGRDLSRPQQTLIGYLIAGSLVGQALDSVNRLVLAGNLRPESLAALRSRLGELEGSWGSLTDSFASGSSFTEAELKGAREAFDEELEALLGEDYGPALEDAMKQQDRVIRESEALTEFDTRFLQIPYWEQDTDTYVKQREELITPFHPLVRWSAAVVSATEPQAKDLTMRSKLRMTQIAVGLELHRNDWGRYPAGLVALTPKYFSSLPIDPFSGEPFKYDANEDGSERRVYSVGPDRKDEGGIVVYDPSNGTFSAGDVFFGRE